MGNKSDNVDFHNTTQFRLGIKASNPNVRQVVQASQALISEGKAFIQTNMVRR